MSRRRFAETLLLFAAIIAKDVVQVLFLADGNARAARAR
jgi:hypothetical protein